MKSLKLLAFPFLLLCVFVIQSCEKDRSLVEGKDLYLDESDCFFSNDCMADNGSKGNDNLTAFTKRIKKYYKSNSSKKESIEQHLGRPFWKHSTDWSTEEEQILYIPVMRSGKVNGLIIGFQKEGMKQPRFKAVKLSKVQKLKVKKNVNARIKFLDQQHAMMVFLYFQQEIEGQIDCKLLKKLNKLLNKGKGGSNSKACNLVVVGAEENCHFIEEEPDGTETPGNYVYSCAIELEWDYICTSRGGYVSDGGSINNPGGAGGRGGTTSGGEESEADGCEPGMVRDERGRCVPRDCGPGKVKDANGACVDEEIYLDNGELEIQNLPKLDVNKSTDQQVVDHFETMLRLRAKFLCLGASWAPINLDRYFSNLTPGNFSGELYGCQVNINVARYSGRTNIGTNYSNRSNADGKTIWTINYDGTSLPGIAITSDESCENTFSDKIWDPEC